MTRPAAKPHHPTTSSTHEHAKEITRKAPENKDPNEYDPVGMAGKKAGIVEEVAQQLDAERQEEDGVDPSLLNGNEHPHNARKEHPGSHGTQQGGPQ